MTFGTILILHILSVLVASFMQQAMGMRRIIWLSMASQPLPYVSILPRKGHDFREKKTQNMGFDFLYKFCLKHFSF